MKHLAQLILALWGLCLPLTVAAQSIAVTNAPNIFVEESISQGEVAAVAAASRSILGVYAEKGHMRDDRGKVSRAAGNEFKNLFKATARIYPDYLEYPGDRNEDIFAYRSTVVSKFARQGLPYTIQNAELMAVMGEGFRFYVAKIRFNKLMQAYLDGRGNVRSAAEGGIRDFRLEMTVEISTEDPSQWHIRSIVCAENCARPKANHSQFMGLTASFGLPASSASALSIPGVRAESTIDFRETLNVGIGARLTSNYLLPRDAQNKNLYLTIGADVRYRRFATDVANYSLDPFPMSDLDGISFDDERAQYERRVTDVSLRERASIVSVEFPLGVSYRILEGVSNFLHLEATAHPSLVVGKSVRWSEGAGRFDGILPGARFSVLRDSEHSGTKDPESNIFNACDCEELRRNETSSIETGLGLWVQLSPTFYTNLNNDRSALGLQISLDMAMNVRSPLGGEPAEQPYLRNPNGESGVFANGYFDTKLHYVGIRAGVYLQTIRPINIR